ncbi:MAG: beta-lactamase family protein [Bacteroidetes bacterium]|nr:beta-lactamase family protein [Bacteroidota bacterium]MBS1974193.1 beta-lactamase family protein [Bacteroidota bacterium]
MKKLLLVLLAIANAIPFSYSQNTKPVLSAQLQTEASGLSADRLKRIDNTVQEYINNKWLNGAVAIIYRNGKLAYYKGFGYDDVDKKTVMRKDAIFRIASQTKALTSTAIMILYEQGKLLIDDAVSKYIPEFHNQHVLDKFNEKDTTYTTVPANRDITIRDLLTHTSGIGYAGIGTPDMIAIYAKNKIPTGLGNIDASLLDRMKALGKLPLQFQPGEKWMYGLNTDLLGCLVEIISGTNLENFIRKNICEPMGMNDTWFNLPKNDANRLTTVYTEDTSGHIIKWAKDHFDVDPDYPLITKHYFSGGAGLSSTAYDYAIFLQMFLNGGIYNGHRILSKRSVEMMTSGQLSFMFNGVDNFGLGFEIVTPQGAAKGPWELGSFSWGGFFGTSYWADPKENLVCLFMTQQSPNSHGDISEKFKALVYQAINE